MAAQSERLNQLPAYISHGQHDADLAFKAGEGLRKFLVEAGARVTWTPFMAATKYL